MTAPIVTPYKRDIVAAPFDYVENDGDLTARSRREFPHGQAAATQGQLWQRVAEGRTAFEGARHAERVMHAAVRAQRASETRVLHPGPLVMNPAASGVIRHEPQPISEAWCPCGYHAWLLEGASDEDQEAHDQAVTDHFAYCDAVGEDA